MTDVIDLDLLNRDLTKWPRLIVVGSPITRQQAKEIIIRTDRLDFSSNDAEFSKQCASYLYRLDTTGNRSRGYWSLSDAFEDKGDKTDWGRYQECRDKAKAELQPLELRYLENSRIVSCWIGGTHGWCDWDGTIRSTNNNIGKWPTVGEVYEDWKAIAQAFPYLSLRCQLITNEGVGDIAVEYHVKDGAVVVQDPGPLLQPLEEVDWADERGCTYEQFVEAVDYTRMQVSTAALSPTMTGNRRRIPMTDNHTRSSYRSI
jgi:hypothetical protein